MALDLTPVLSVIIHLIPMLLILVRFRQLAEVEVQQPIVPALPAPSAAALAEQEERVVSVTITETGYVVTGTADGSQAVPCLGACTPKTYDVAGLTQALKAAQAQHPAERRVVIAPAPRVPYEVVVAAMDAARAYSVNGKLVPLFPEPILTSPPPGRSR